MFPRGCAAAPHTGALNQSRFPLLAGRAAASSAPPARCGPANGKRKHSSPPGTLFLYWQCLAERYSAAYAMEEKFMAQSPTGAGPQGRGTAKRAGGWVKIIPQVERQSLRCSFAVQRKIRRSSHWHGASHRGARPQAAGGTAMGGGWDSIINQKYTLHKKKGPASPAGAFLYVPVSR